MVKDLCAVRIDESWVGRLQSPWTPRNSDTNIELRQSWRSSFTRTMLRRNSGFKAHTDSLPTGAHESRSRASSKAGCPEASVWYCHVSSLESGRSQLDISMRAPQLLEKTNVSTAVAMSCPRTTTSSVTHGPATKTNGNEGQSRRPCHDHRCQLIRDVSDVGGTASHVRKIPTTAQFLQGRLSNESLRGCCVHPRKTLFNRQERLVKNGASQLGRTVSSQKTFMSRSWSTVTLLAQQCS